MSTSPLQPPPPRASDTEVQWGQLTDAALSLAVASLGQNQTKPLLVITPDAHSANQLQAELRFFIDDKNFPIYLFPDWETLPYDHFSPHQGLISERLRTLAKIPNLANGIMIAAIPTLLHRLLPPEYLHLHSLVINSEQKLDLEQLKLNLANSGYYHVEQVREHGEFALRGSILDLFPMGSNVPFRIDFFDDEIESIRSFDPETQISVEKYHSIELLPAREFPLTDEAISYFRTAWRERFAGNPMNAPIYQHISEGEVAAGVEYYLPLFFKELSNIFAFIPQNTQIIFSDKAYQAAEHFWQEINERYEQLRYDQNKPLCEPVDIFIPVNEFYADLKKYIKIHIQYDEQKKVNYQFNTNPLPDLRINNKLPNPLKLLQEFTETFQGKILICAESAGRREVLLDLLQQADLTAHQVNSWKTFLNAEQTINITVAPLTQGLCLPQKKIALITETQLFGAQVQQRRYRKQRALDPDTLIKDLTELKIGAPVVHIQHGVGRYRGLQLIKTGDIEAEYLTLEFAEKAKIYVPVSSLDLISRYTGTDPDHAPLHRLGSKQWDKLKKKAQEKIFDVAAELLDIYSQREAATGFAFKKFPKEQQQFRDAFPFEETPDQAQAIDAVIDDMHKTRCMDRLVCGDVGFGKTEVAMHAAFMAALNNKQVAMLVPTTLLATQHTQTFQDRFADWPIRIAGLSRFNTPKETADILKDVKNGVIDIVIGTHKLLQQEIKFKDLGLLIVDEEHRFGVRQKEKIKQLRAHVDILTMTATPIPRTLNMALSGTRDLSIIATPPARRLAIKTFWHQSQDSLIREAVMREAMRGGQVYFMHNEVATIDAQHEKLQNIIPEARITIAHGQMRERELERVMRDFYHQKFNVLLCTTIIESGIDVPTANTIIINRADKFGLAQLHQIRGRVGRSHHQAYAYLLTPPPKAITKDARQRLDAITSLEDLGAGFMLATHDLEIRGAGEILGEEQSGHIEAIGFSLYMELLEEAVEVLKSGEKPRTDLATKTGPDIDLKISALFPDNYIHDVHTRLTLYKRLANCTNTEAVNEFKAELVDRFGLLPKPTENLIHLAQLKITAKQLGIAKVEAGTQYGYLHFNDKPNIDPAVIIKLIQIKPKEFQLQGPSKLRFILNKEIERAQQVQAVFKTLVSS
jgi:transcription-repair coupling factor (superfamily II helicase)